MDQMAIPPIAMAAPTSSKLCFLCVSCMATGIKRYKIRTSYAFLCVKFSV